MKIKTGDDQVVDVTEVTEIDLDKNPIEVDGQRLDEAGAERLAQQILASHAAIRREGRPSIDGGPGKSPRLAFRVPADLRRRLNERAAAEHRSASTIAREALERYLAS